jgi:transposase InsO family protein
LPGDQDRAAFTTSARQSDAQTDDHPFRDAQAIRSDNGSELLASALQEQIKHYGVKLANIEPGKPWQNGSNESFNGTFRKECLNAEIFTSVTEARVIIEKWRRRYNERRPHSSHNYITPEMAYFGVREKRKT